MQPLKFWSFLVRCLARAAVESTDFFELKMKTAITGIVLVVLGFGLLFLVRGREETREELSKYIILVPVPAILFLAGLFLYNAFRAPYLIYVEEYGKAQTGIAEANRARAIAEDALLVAGTKLATQQQEIDNLKKHPSVSKEPSRTVESDWVFSPEKADAFVAGTKTATAKFSIITAVDDSQSNRFGLQLLSLLKRAGWMPIQDQTIRTPWVGRFQGVTIHVSHQDFQAASDLQTAFKTLGISAEGKITTGLPPDVIEIHVGYKPDYWKY
jgi:hypothetical protein